MLFNDRRPSSVRDNQSGGVEDAIASGKRVLISHHNEDTNSPIGTLEGYLRKDPDGEHRVYHNARSTKGQAINVDDLAVIESASRSKSGRRETFLDHPSKEDIKWHGNSHYFD